MRVVKKTHMVLATIVDGKTASSWGERKRTTKTHPESILDGPLLGGSSGAR